MGLFASLFGERTSSSLWYLGLIRTRPLLLLVLSWVSPCHGEMRFPNPSKIENNMWREEREAVFKAESSTLYAKDRHCVPPTDVEPLVLKTHNNASWSSLFSRYTLDAGDELDVWLANQERYPETQDEKIDIDYLDILIPALVPLFFAVFLMVCVILIPFLGAVAFRVLMITWWLLTHSEIRRTGRRALIMYENCLRRRQKMLMPASVKKPPKSRFYLPNFFRLYSEEDIPSEMDETDDEDDFDVSDSDDDDKAKFEAEGVSLSGLNTETSQESEVEDEGKLEEVEHKEDAKDKGDGDVNE